MVHTLHHGEFSPKYRMPQHSSDSWNEAHFHIYVLTVEAGDSLATKTLSR